MLSFAILAGLLVTPGTDFSPDPQVHKAWIEQACRIQQVGHSGGVPDDHRAFCACYAEDLQATTTPELYRLFALGSQGAVRDEAEIADWQAARDLAQAEFNTLDAQTQASAPALLSASLGACIGVSSGAD